MSAEDVVTLQEVAFAIVQGNGTIRAVRGCTAIRNGAGDYTVTLDPSGQSAQLAAAEMVAAVGLIGAGDLKATVRNLSNTQKGVLIGNLAGVATDAEFSLTLSRLLGVSNPLL